MNENKNTSTHLSVIIPIYNEESGIEELYTRLKTAVLSITESYEFIFVNDGSKDNSLFELIKLTERDPRVFYLHFSRNFGHQKAVTAGIDHCRGEAVVIMDGDLQDPPEEIPNLYAKYKEGFDVVYAKRIERKGESWFKKITAILFYRLLRLLTTIDIPVDTGDFRLIDAKVVHYLKKMPEQNKFLRGQIAWMGFKQTSILFRRDERKYGKTGYSLRKMIRFAMDGITSFSDVPLKIVSRVGFIFAFIAILVIFYALFSYFVLHRTITGWTSLIISSMFIGGVQLISVGIIGEYISRMNQNLLNRPLYIIEKTNILK